MSVTRLLLLVLGAICLIAGVFKLVQGPYDFLTIGIALGLIVIGYVLVSGRGLTL
jgi:hypothetical protein